MSRRVSRIIQRTVLLHLAAGAPVLVACGGQTRGSSPEDAGAGESSATDSGSTTDTGTPRDAGVCNDAVDAGPPCTVIACVAPIINDFNGPACASSQLAIYGTATDCADPATVCESLCPGSLDAGGGTQPFYDCTLSGRSVYCNYGAAPCYVTGRRPRGLQRCAPGHAPHAVGRHLAQMAHLEAASVPAFARLARELEAYDAPRSLRRAALRAARDETRHARVVTRLAQRAGATVRRPRVRDGKPRSLEAIAIENAIEGCVRETFGAAVAVAQSISASDPVVRAAMRRIATDETRHAELAWQVARWIEGRLDGAARDRVTRARRRAARALVQSVSTSVHPSLVRELGIPPAQVAVAMASDLDTSLWGN